MIPSPLTSHKAAVDAVLIFETMVFCDDVDEFHQFNCFVAQL
jgi:hypothetical protein